ncbi:hypothetical protein [Pseudohongiella sp.]|uniref:hypothetical protein n=1 Tax=Pseudohongiella sp. TaxID=1979412 RepID=UPI0025DF0953|nr:hypothetical protein [Pseudohongiella sp.]
MFYPVRVAMVGEQACTSVKSLSAGDGATEVFFGSMGAYWARSTLSEAMSDCMADIAGR